MRSRAQRLSKLSPRRTLLCLAAFACAACGSPDADENPDTSFITALRHGWSFAWEPEEHARPQWSELSGTQRYFPIQEPRRLRLRIELPADPCRDPVVYLGLVNQSFVAYVDDAPVYRFGRPEDGRAGFAGWPFHMIPVPATRAGARMLELRIFSDFTNIGVGGGVPELACRDAKLLDLLREDLPQASVAGLALLAGCIVLALYRSGGRDPLFVSFALFSITAGTYLISNRTFRLQNLIIYAPMAWMILSYVTLYIIPVAAGYFFRHVFEFSRPLLWAFRLWVLTIAALLMTNIVGWVPWYRAHDPFLVSIGCVLLVTDVWMVRALFEEERERRILAGVVLLYSAGAAYDIAGALGLVPWPVQGITIGFGIVLLGMAFVVWHRYQATHRAAARYARDLEVAHRALQNYASDLEAEVAARTESLARSLEDVRRLKEQQDGDYFLVSRLIEPMGDAELKCGAVTLSAFVEQRKKFRFRDWAGEVGGDLCLADRIVLEGKEYAFFMNADAMGKSMQGAGGAIVLAVTYRALVSRSAGGVSESPEAWLLNALNEVNFALAPFEGRMLVSLAMGLVDAGGEVLFRSADHPEPVLYRDRQARLLPVRRAGTKLGHGDPAQFAAGEAERLQLQPGDRLIFGSDGRDDLAVAGDAVGLPKSGEAQRQVDSDAQRFVEVVEQSDGELTAIVRNLHGRGEIIDDLSLLCLRRE